MIQKIKNVIIILPLVCLIAVNSYGQTWQIGYPTVSSVTATFNNGILNISGSGAMMDISYSTPPWNNVKSNITGIIINNGVTKISNYAFSACDNATFISIPASLSSISNAEPFGVGITTINVDANNLTYSSQDGVLFNKNKTTLIHYPISKAGNSYTIPNTVQTIGYQSFFCNKNLNLINIPKSVKDIRALAFAHCEELTSISIPGSVTDIREVSFLYCYKLSSVTIENGVKNIESGAFESCFSLTSIFIPSTVTKMVGASNFVVIDETEVACVFWRCENLREINIDANNTVYSSQDGVVFNKNKTTLFCCPNGKTGSYSIPNTVKTIKGQAFSYGRLSSVIIPSSVSAIEDGAFGEGGGKMFKPYYLTDVTVNWATPLSIPYDAFSDNNLSNVNLHIPDGTYDLYTTTLVWKEFNIIKPTPTLTVSPTSYSFGAGGGTSSSINVTSNQTWTVSSNASWLTTSRTSGSNNNTFTMSATAYTTTSSRSAIVSVSGGGITRTINVMQVGNSPCSVGPLLNTQWSQGEPYNNEVVAKLGNFPTGCVATAMAQIMNYWQHPTQRTLTIPTYTTSELRIDIPSITSTTTYDWNNMKNTTAEYTTSTQRNAIAKLMYECGVAVKMNYTSNGSGANNNSVYSALPFYFGYDNAIEIKSRQDFSNTDWDNMLRSELDVGRPIYYTGSDPRPRGGHAFVCDGYNCENKFHFNWGWGGVGDGYFVTSALNVTEYTFNMSQAIIINIKPNQIYLSNPTEPDGVNTFIIYANEGLGGSLIPSDFTIIYRGSNQPYTFEPYYDYEIDQVLIDGIPNATAKANGYYTFSNVT